MTINISPDLEQKLIVKLAEGFQNTVPDQSYIISLDFRWADELSKELTADANLKIDQHLGENGLSKFVYAYIQETYLSGSSKSRIQKGVPVSNQTFIQNNIQLSRDIIEALRQVPLRYRLTVALPASFSDPILDHAEVCYDFPSGISISRAAVAVKSLPVHSSDPVIDKTLFTDFFGDDEENHRDIQSDRYYFSMPLQGYVTRTASTALGRNFEDHLRALYGAGLATKLLSWNFRGRSNLLPYIMIHSESDRKLIETERLEEDLVKSELRMGTQDFIDRNKKQTKEAFSFAFNRIATIFHNQTDCRKLHTACIWYYRASVNKRPLDSLLEATIAIEVMLGDRKASEGVGLSNLLGNRCAFLLGNSSKVREQIMENFHTIYKLRSNIVHEGRHVLHSGDRRVVDLCLSMCSAIIKKELTVRGNDVSNNLAL